MADDAFAGDWRGQALSGNTIFALSSGTPPAAIAIIRISGPHARSALAQLTPTPVVPRIATLRALRDPADASILDTALVLAMPAPATATGEDIVELHLHGGRAIVAAVERALASLPGLRPALPGEFTRRAFANGLIDLSQAQGLADLLAAETEGQRRAALSMAEGGLRRMLDEWRTSFVAMSARCEAALDFADEADVPGDSASLRTEVMALGMMMRGMLERPPAERLRDGVRVVIAGPPNAGKSTLLNAIAGRDVAITSPLPGTTRDRIEAPVILRGLPIVLTDTAGLRETADDVELLGIERARRAMVSADVVLWLGDPSDAPSHACVLQVEPKADLGARGWANAVRTSAVGEPGIGALLDTLEALVRTVLPAGDGLALHAYQRAALAIAVDALDRAAGLDDELLLAEELRLALSAFDRITGAADVEHVLDQVFASFCIGK